MFCAVGPGHTSDLGAGGLREGTAANPSLALAPYEREVGSGQLVTNCQVGMLEPTRERHNPAGSGARGGVVGESRITWPVVRALVSLGLAWFRLGFSGMR
jgi:hypothetical protein